MDDDLLDTGPDIDELDDEMRTLLTQLEHSPQEYLNKLEPVGIPGNPSPDLGVSPNTTPASDSGPIPAEELVSKDFIKPEVVPVLDAAIVAPEQPIVDLRKQFAQFDEVTNEILQGTRGDRQETQDAINIMRSEIDKAISNNHQPARMYVDNLTKALEVKATINMTAVKAMEAKAKLLAATRAGINIQNTLHNNQANVTTASDATLVDLLNNNPLQAGINGDDEY